MRYIILMTLFLCISCAKNEEEIVTTTNLPSTSLKVDAKDNLNISILLDLSDRINPTKYPNSAMEFYQRDAENIKTVSNSFLSYVRHKKIILLNDNMQVYFNPEPANAEINQMSRNLKIHLDRNINKNTLQEVQQVYDSIPLEIYKAAIDDNLYVGSDIWRFFKDKVHQYAIKEDHRNILVILTDGYMYHQNTRLEEGNLLSYLIPQKVQALNLNQADWKTKMEDQNIGFIPANQDLGNLEILVIGLNPSQNNPYEKDVLVKFWTDWLTAMGVNKFELLDADLPSNQQIVIENFILIP